MPLLNQFKGFAKQCGYFLRLSSLDRQAAALLWAIAGETTNDDMPTFYYCAVHLLNVQPCISVISQEMQHGAIVPDINGCWSEHMLQHIAHNPFDITCLITKAPPGDVH